jgi:hypothetical protein
MCDHEHEGHATNLIRKACAEQNFGEHLIVIITEHIRRHLKMDPQPTITFSAWFNEATSPSGFISFRVEFFRKDWEQLRAALMIGETGSWNGETLSYQGDLFEVSANAADQEVHVVFW